MGNRSIATKKGGNPLNRGSQVHFMAEFQELLDFPPAPKLTVLGKLDPKRPPSRRCGGRNCSLAKPSAPPASSAVLHRQSHAQSQVERFYKPRMINGRMASADGPIKTFPLRGIKDSPPYLHDGRLLTLEDTVSSST